MRLKGLISALAAGVLLLTGCARESSSAPAFDEARHTAALREFWGDKYNLPESPAEDFLYHYDEELGGIVITDYLGDSRDVRVPATIDGSRVLAVDLQYCYKYLEALMLPDSVEQVRLVSYDGIAAYIDGEDITPAGQLPHYHVEEINGIVIDSYLGTSKKVHISDTQHCNEHSPQYAVGNYHVDMLYFRELDADIEMLILADGIDTVYEGKYGGAVVYESQLDSYLSCMERAGRKYTKIGVAKMNIPAAFRFDRDYAFASSTLTSVFIPETVTEIGGWAFSKSPLLTEAVIAAEKVSVGQQAFYYCDALESIDTSRITYEGKWAFQGCKNLPQ